MRTLEATIVCGALFVMAFTGCGTTSKEIQVKSQSERTDVFMETKADAPAPKGYAVLLLRASIKTPLESDNSLYGRPGYSFLVNIDGQAAMWEVGGIKDSKPAYDTDGKTSRDPEAGEGIKCVLEKRLRLRAGRHQIFFGLPEENFFITTDIMLKGGKKAVLEYKPIYRYKTLPTRIPTFLKGIDKYEVFLNGKQL